MRSVLLPLMTTLVASAAAPESGAQESRAQDAPVREAPPREAPAREAAARLRCMSTEQWRRETSGLKLLDPFQCMRETALHHQAEALGARLCRFGEIMLYEIKLLTQTGHVQKVLVDAVSGRPHSGASEK